MTPSSTPAKTEPWISRESFGLALILVGQSLGWAVRGMTGGGESSFFAVAPMIVGLGLLMKPEWIFGTKLYSDPVLAAIPFLVLVVPYTLLMLTDPSLWANGGYMVALCILIVFVALTPPERFRTLSRAVLVVGLIESMDPFIQLLLDGTQETYMRLQVAGNSNVLITGTVGGITMVSSIMVGDEEGGSNGFTGLLASVAFITGLGALLLSDKRSDELIMFAVIGVYLLLRLRRERAPGAPLVGRQRLVFGSVLLGGVASLPALATLFFNKNALMVFAVTSEAHKNGFFNSVSAGSSYVADTSTASRFATIEFAFNRLSILGAGAMHQAIMQGSGEYTHMSYLQAYYDMGVLGGTSYLFVMLLMPAALSLLRALLAPLSQTDIFVILLWIYVQGDTFTHGVPYNWTSLAPAALIYLLLFGRTEGAEEAEGSDQDQDAPRTAKALPSS